MQDLRLVFRALRATPVVSAVAALALALGIGANTAIFPSSTACCCDVELSINRDLTLTFQPLADQENLQFLSLNAPATPARTVGRVRQLK